MSWALLAAVLAAGEPEFEPQATVWLQPLGLVLAPLPVTSGFQAFYLSAGATVLTGSGLEIAAEVGGYQSKSVSTFSPDRDTTVQRGFLMAVGPVFHTGDRPFCGFFVEPKLVIEIAGGELHEPPSRPRDAGSRFSVQAGATAGWQVRWRRLFLAVSAGASVGIGNRPFGPIGPTLPGFGAATLGFQWGVDVNLLRIGIAI